MLKAVSVWQKAEMGGLGNAAMQDMLVDMTEHSALFKKYADKIAQEQGLDRAEPEHILHSIANMQNFVSKGPLVKLMRWFSWFESATMYAPELHGVKMVFEYMGGGPAQLAQEDAEGHALPAQEDEQPFVDEDPQEVLRNLKKALELQRGVPT